MRFQLFQPSTETKSPYHQAFIFILEHLDLQELRQNLSNHIQRPNWATRCGISGPLRKTYPPAWWITLSMPTVHARFADHVSDVYLGCFRNYLALDEYLWRRLTLID